MQCACTVLHSHVTSMAVPNFPHSLTNGMMFGNKLWSAECGYSASLQLLNETFLIPRRTERDIFINVPTLRLHVQYLLLMYSTCCWCTVPVVHVQYLLFMYSTCCSCTVPVVHVQYLLFMYSTYGSCTVPVVHVQYLLFMYSTCCSCQI
jgi:hypothetical protein